MIDFRKNPAQPIAGFFDRTPNATPRKGFEGFELQVFLAGLEPDCAGLKTRRLVVAKLPFRS